eukprot:14108439-Alexandrium_andersonii.AAC.1
MVTCQEGCGLCERGHCSSIRMTLLHTLMSRQCVSVYRGSPADDHVSCGRTRGPTKGMPSKALAT